MDIFLQETAHRIGDDDVLAKAEVLLDWSDPEARVKAVQFWASGL